MQTAQAPVLRACCNLSITVRNDQGLGIPMSKTRVIGRMAALSLAVFLAACGGRVGVTDPDSERIVGDGDSARERDIRTGTTLGEALRARRNQESIVRVNRYIWSATLQVLDFLPIQSVDPFTGVIVTGFGVSTLVLTFEILFPGVLRKILFWGSEDEVQFIGQQQRTDAR